MKRLSLLLVVLISLMPLALAAQSSAPPLRLEINGVDTSAFPTVTIDANVTDLVGQSVLGLGVDDFSVLGELASIGQIVDVQNVTDDALDISVVLAIDTSTSMQGTPLQGAKEAAISFINQIDEGDTVAIVAFDSRERLVQDFTTDKQALTDAINQLFADGRTALYDGSVLAIQTAANSPSPRHTVIILSDGAEYGNLSSSPREAAADTALQEGVPTNTIGLGFGTDRSYLEDLANATLARFFESPTPDELQGIYDSLAKSLRSQYIVTLQVDTALIDPGKNYPLVLQVIADNRVATSIGRVRVPIPAPVIALPALPATPISEPTTITVDVQADDPITSAEFQLNGTGQGALTTAPYTITIDPVTLQPGTNSLGFSATDSTGDTTSAAIDFEVAALPPVVSVLGLPTGDLSEAQEIILDVTGQTPAASAVYSVDGKEEATVEQVPFSFTLDPYNYAPGEHTLSVTVTNAGGASTQVDSPFSVAALPPSFTISGLDAAQVISTPTTLTVEPDRSQAAIDTIAVSVGGTELASVSGENRLEVTIDPAVLPPGSSILSVSVTDANGNTTTQDIAIEVAALPAEVTVNGLEAGETLDADREVSIETVSQTPISSVRYLVDGAEIAAPAEAPYTAQIDALATGEGGHILTVEVTNEGGQTTSVNVAFSVSAAPSLTATASVPTSTPAPTNTPEPTDVPPTDVPTTEPSAEPTEVSAQVATAENTPEAGATEVAVVASATTESATADTGAAATQTASAQMNVLLTEQAASAAEAQATLDAQATANADATAQAANAAATANADSTAQAANADATAQAANAAATANADSTAQAANADATAQAANAAATANADSTAQAANVAVDATAEVTAEATEEATTVAPTEEVTAEATAAVAEVTPSGEATEVTDRTPEPTFTPIPLTSETQTAATDNNNLVPIAILCGVGLLILLVLFLVLGRRGQKQNPTTRR